MSESSSFSDVEMKVIMWAEDRGIIPNSTPGTQLLKSLSELGELADATIKGNREGMKDGVGDVLVCLINYCALTDLTILECLNHSFEQIKDRKGKLLPSGVFVKEE